MASSYWVTNDFGGWIKGTRYLSTLTGRAFQVQCCADDAGAVTHNPDAHAGGTAGRLKTRAIVANREHETVIVARNGNGDAGGLAVFDGIQNRLLNDVIQMQRNGAFNHEGRLVTGELALYLEQIFGVGGEFFNR
jgi:hypothetical protein